MVRQTRPPRPIEIANSLPAKKARGKKAASKISKQIRRVGSTLTHEETVRLFAVPLDPADALRREDFQRRLGEVVPTISIYYADLSAMDERQKRFLAAYAETGLNRDACIAAQVSRRTLQEWLETDPVFVELYEDAEQDATDDLEAHAIGRAKALSDPLMILMLKARRPDKYLERSQVEVAKSKKDRVNRQKWTIGDLTLEF